MANAQNTHHPDSPLHPLIYVGPDPCLGEFSFGESDAGLPSFTNHFLSLGIPHSECFDRRLSPPSTTGTKSLNREKISSSHPAPSSKGCEHKMVAGPSEAPSHQGLKEEECRKESASICTAGQGLLSLERPAYKAGSWLASENLKQLPPQ